MIGAAAEFVAAGNVRHARARQAADREDEEARRNPLAAIRPHDPAPVIVIVRRRGDAGPEPDVAAEIEPVGDVLGVAEDLGLRGVALAPAPFLLQGVVERVGILHALDVAASAGIAVPVPGAADPVPGLEDAALEAERPHPVQHVEAGEAGADDHHVQPFHPGRVRVRGGSRNPMLGGGRGAER